MLGRPGPIITRVDEQRYSTSYLSSHILTHPQASYHDDWNAAGKYYKKRLKARVIGSMKPLVFRVSERSYRFNPKIDWYENRAYWYRVVIRLTPDNDETF
jgi:hypothetical protein